MSERDLFANFDRMRREMDELFGDVLQRGGIARRRGGFSPAVDVAYVSDPPRAIVTAELAGVEIDELELKIEGRKLILAGRRGPAAPEGEVYQQVEIERGSFRRVIELGAEVRGDQASASYERGMLRVELPLRHSEPDRPARPVPTASQDTGK
jgi:HSP20 family protein